MAENETTMFESALKQVDEVVGTSGRRSGDLNSLGYGLLVYPDDMQSLETNIGILNWIEFTTFFKKNGSLSGTFLKTANKIGQGLGLTDPAAGTDTASINSETITQLSQLKGSDSDTTQQSVLADTRLSRAEAKTGDQIALYLPGGLGFDDSLKYESKAFAGLKNLGNVSAMAGSAAIGVLRKLASGVDKLGGFIGQDSLNTSDAISAELGIVANPRSEQLFQGVDMRTFAFAFNFIPRSEKEADTVKKIIETFRFHSYPEISPNSAFFQFPSEFEIKFMTMDPDEGGAKPNPILPKLRRCYLSKVETNYTPDEVYYSFKNGTPPRIELKLSFIEVEQIARNHIKEGY